MDTLRSAGGRVRVVVTLRGDFYDRPLREPEFAPVFSTGVVNVLPPVSGELEEAVVEPARHVGVAVEPALLAELVTDAAGQPGALPLFQYALTELFDRREGATVTLKLYRGLGGLRGVVSRRAEELYRSRTPAQQRVAQQAFLRLVTPGEGTKDTRRRVRAGELSALALDQVDLAAVLERFGRHRLLTFDRDVGSGEATVEVAHEALLDEWSRLRAWIDEHRADLRRHQTLAAAVDEWQAAGRDADYLLSGSRLALYDHWSRQSDMQLTATERAFLDASRQRRRDEEERDAARQAQAARLERRARSGLWALFGAVALLGAATTALVLAVGATRPPDVALVFDGRDGVGFPEMIAAGFDRAVEEFAVDAEEVAPGTIERVRRLAEQAIPLVIVTGNAAWEVEAVAPEYPQTLFAVLDAFGDPAPNITYLHFAEEQGSFIVGAAAALKSRTGTIGFIGGVDLPLIWKFQAGFEAGARHVDPHIRILDSYLSQPPDWSGFSSPTLGAQAATELYRSGVDVIYHAAGASGLGLFEAAVAESRAHDRHLWVIGVDIDEYENDPGPVWRYGPDDWRPHILTSMMKRMDVAVHRTIADYVQKTLITGERMYDLADGGLEYATSGGFIDDVVPELERLRQDIVEGRIVVPTEP